MNIKKAILIFEDVDNPAFSEMEKTEAIAEVLDLPTHNSISKASILKAFRWLLEAVTTEFDVEEATYEETEEK